MTRGFPFPDYFPRWPNSRGTQSIKEAPGCQGDETSLSPKTKLGYVARNKAIVQPCGSPGFDQKHSNHRRQFENSSGTHGERNRERLVGGLPIHGIANVWGEEIYFSTPVTAQPEDSAREEMEVGEIAYRPPGKAFCIFFGRTPASVDNAPRAASSVNPLGKVVDNPKIFLKVRSGEEVLLERTT